MLQNKYFIDINNNVIQGKSMCSILLFLVCAAKIGLPLQQLHDLPDSRQALQQLHDLPDSRQGLARNQGNVSECGYMSTYGLLFQ
jgi:hypothetical protein